MTWRDNSPVVPTAVAHRRRPAAGTASDAGVGKRQNSAGRRPLQFGDRTAVPRQEQEDAEVVLLDDDLHLLDSDRLQDLTRRRRSGGRAAGARSRSLTVGATCRRSCCRRPPTWQRSGPAWIERFATTFLKLMRSSSGRLPGRLQCVGVSSNRWSPSPIAGPSCANRRSVRWRRCGRKDDDGGEPADRSGRISTRCPRRPGHDRCVGGRASACSSARLEHPGRGPEGTALARGMGARSWTTVCSGSAVSARVRECCAGSADHANDRH